MTPEQSSFWNRFKRETGTSGEPFDIDQFGDSPEMADELLELVLIGRKQATCALARWFEGPGRRLPQAGDFSLILDGRGSPRCVVRTTSVEVKPIQQADTQFAWHEGEGDRSFEWWLTEHRKFWRREAEREGFEYSDDLDAVFEHFELAWTPV